MKPYLAECNEMQRKAVMHESGPVLCLAGPGSGKTTVLSAHIKYLIEEMKVEPSHILVITFSKAAAKEMQLRFLSLMGNNYFPVTFGTFHAVFFHMLCQNLSYSKKSILTLNEKIKYAKTVLLEMNPSFLIDGERISELLRNISCLKNRGQTAGNFTGNEEIRIMGEEFDFPEFYRRYQQLLHENRKLDFDDMMILCDRMLSENSEILSYYQNLYRYILIDEYQDINPVQYAVIRKLILPDNNLFAVGDDDQSIYGFRGCDPSIMLRFQEDFETGEVITFPINYRSAPAIVEGAKKLISENHRRYRKDYRALKKGSDSSSDSGIFLLGMKTEEEEMQKSVELIREFCKKGIESRCAVLFRTNLECSSFSELLMKNRIPCQLKEKVKNIYNSFICRDLLCYLRLSRGQGSMEDFVTVMNRPCRYLSRHAVQNGKFSFHDLYGFYQENPRMTAVLRKMEYDLHWLSQMDFYAAVNYIRKGVGYEDFLKEQSSGQKDSLEKWMGTLNELHQRLGEFQTLESLESYMKDYAERLQEQQSGEKGEGIVLMTYHASKGLEFDRVLLPHCNEGMTPLRKCIGKEAVEEERRLFYVALTRAKYCVYISFLKGGQNDAHLPSRFLKPFMKNNCGGKQKSGRAISG